MCDPKNELHKSENDKSKDNTSTRLELDITETDTYPEFDFLDLLRNIQIENKKAKAKTSKINSEETANKSNLFSEDSEVEALARLYEEKYGNYNDYAEYGEGYDDEDSFIDNTDAVNDLVPNGIRTEFGGFYINRGKLTFVKEDNSSSSTSEDADKFLAHNRLNARRIVSDDDEEKEKDGSKVQSNNNNNNNSGGIVKSRKRSGEFQHKSKKIRKTATPKIPDHLLHRKPFSGSSEFRKNINEIKKNRLKIVDTDKKSEGVHANVVNNNNNHNKEVTVKKKAATVKDLLKERDGASEVIEAVATGADLIGKECSSSTESSDSSSSDSESETSEDVATEKDKVSMPVATDDAVTDTNKRPPVTSNGPETEEITAKTFAHLDDSLKDLLGKIIQISKEEKNKMSNSKLNTLLLGVDNRLRDLSVSERNAVLDKLAIILQMKKESITKRTKKLLFVQEEAKMTAPLRKLKDAVADMMPLLESNYFKEFTKAAGTSPQIYAELTRYYWSIDPGSLPQRKFPWNDELRGYLREIIQLRKNCYYIIRPRKDTINDYVRTFLDTKLKPFWPKDWMTVDILVEEGQTAQTTGPIEEKQKAVTKIFGTHNTPNVIPQRKTPTTVPTTLGVNRKQQPQPPATTTTTATAAAAATSVITSRKPPLLTNKTPEVKSILIPRKTPHGGNSSNILTKPHAFTPTTSVSVTSTNSLNSNGSRLQVNVNRAAVQDYLDRISGSANSIKVTTTQQISPNRTQQPISPNRLLKNLSPNSINQNPNRPNTVRTSSPNAISKAMSTFRNCNNAQSVLKTIEIHSSPITGAKSSSNSVTILPIGETKLKDTSEVLNLTKNSSVYISKVTDETNSKTNRSNSPSIGIPLPSGITISPTNATTSNFLNKPKPVERSPDVKINVSITKQEQPLNPAKDKRESVLNMNIKRDGPLQNIPDCISVTSKVVSNERHKYEHVRKRALQEYHQQNSPERLKLEEKKIKTEEILIADTEIKEEKLDDRSFSKIFDSVIAKTSETVRQSEIPECKTNLTDRYTNLSIDSLVNSSSIPVKHTAAGLSQAKSNAHKLRDIRLSKDKYPFGPEEKRLEEEDERNENSTKERLVQMEMDRVMQNLVELSNQRERNSEYDSEMQSVGFSQIHPPTEPPTRPKTSSFQEAFQKMLFK